MGNVSRSTGRSCVQAVAYIARAELYEERRGIFANYSDITDHDVFWETLGPDGSNIKKDDLSIWNKVEDAEDKILAKRYKDPEIRAQKINEAVPAYSDHLALPKELSKEQNIELAREFIQRRYVDKGLIATYSIHWEEGNPHLHYVYSARQYVNGEFSQVKTVSRETRGPKGGYETRIILADIINKYQEMLGIQDRVDHRSYAERGLDLIPTQHKGWMSHQLERNGKVSRIAKDNEQISEANKERIAREPKIILDELTSTQATFSENDVLNLVHRRLKDDMGLLGEHVFHAVMKEAVEVGKTFHEQTRYTSQAYADKEARILESFEDYQQSKTILKVEPSKVDALLGNLQEQGKEKGYVPNEGQVTGIKTLCGDSRLYVMIGRAGTGKTTTLRSVVDLHKEAGYQVWGMAPSSTAATQLGEDTGCYSDTISHYAFYWKKHEDAVALLKASTTEKEAKAAQKAIDRYRAYLPNDRTLLIIDEAGMVGSGDLDGKIPGGWDAITKIVDFTRAKLILTGDDHQLKPIESGDFFRRLVQWLRGTDQLCELTEIMRQNIPWMREASSHLSEFNVATALGMYENNGHIHAYSLNDDIYKAMAKEYLQKVVQQPGSRGAVIAATNEERMALNREIRAILKANDLLPKQDAMQHKGEGFTVGDKITFLKNDRGWNTTVESQKEGFFVQNSMHAIIQSIKTRIATDKDTGKEIKSFEVTANVFDEVGAVKGKVTFDTNDYTAFTYGYAGTVWKTQGNTVDWILAKLSKYIDANTLYVAATRHRDDISMYYSTEDFNTYQQLVNSLSKTNVKDLVVDYSISDENREYWSNVQEYKMTGRELLGIRTLANSFDKNDKKNKAELEAVWKNYRNAEEDRKSWAIHILRDWDVHKDFVRQAGLARESLEIAAGLKKRTLSRVEIEAQQTVEQYISVALETRQLWRDIRRTHPGIRAKGHPEWPKFEDARNQRGILANQICLNPTLHRPFLKETAEQLVKADIGYVAKDSKISSGTSAYSMATIKAQAEAHQSKMLQAGLLKDSTNPAQKEKLEVLIAYIEARDHFGQMWAETKPRRDALKDSLLEGSLAKELSDCMKMGAVRDSYAVEIFDKREEFEALSKKVGVKINFDRLPEEAARGRANSLIKTYKTSKEVTTKLEAAFEINSLMKGEAGLKNKPTISQVFGQGLQPKDIANDALEYQKIKLFESLKEGAERDLFLLLDEYDAKCRKANRIYSLCIEDTKGKDKKPWESSHYPAYKDACDSRNELTLEIFDQRDHNQVIGMAEAMGIRFKDVELEEIFSRCEQVTRTNNILSYQSANGPQGQDPETKGKAAVALRQMINFERRDSSSPSPTARQAFYAGIDFKEMQTIAFQYGRSCVLKGLSSQEEIGIYHALEAYENALRPASRAYKECIEESKEKTTKDLEVKPWETEKFKEYISLVTIQDEKAYELIKQYDAPTVTKVAQQMGISPKKLDVEAHRHSLRQTLQTFMEGDAKNGPMAGQELLNWLEFDRHSDHKHTFKVLREQDLWPKDIFESLQGFIEKKREWRYEEQRGIKDAAKAQTQGHDSFKPKYKIITYERRQSFEELNKQLSDRVYELATHILGKPTSKNRDSLRFGSNGSMCVAIKGPKQGQHYSFETRIGGGPLDLIQQQMNFELRDAIKWATEWLGSNPMVIEQRVVQSHQKEKEASTWKPITPIPSHVKAPGNKFFNYLLKDGYRETTRHTYRDEQGRLLGYIVRFERPNPQDPNGKNSKTTRPLAYCEDEKGYRKWKSQGFFGAEKLPYGLEKLAQDHDKTILVVEGEKSADTAQKLLPEYHVLGWIGGAGSINQTNWGCLVGREVVVWPDHDHDQGGQKAAQKLQKIVTNLNKKAGKNGRIGIVNLPGYLPNKWDLADKLPESWTLDTVREMIKDALPKDKKLPHGQSVTDTVSDSQKPKINIEEAADQFIDLCMRYEAMSWHHPDDSKTLREIEALAGKYMNNEEFRNRIASCGNEVVIERFQTEMEEQKYLLIQDNYSSGVSNEGTTLPGETSEHNTAATKIEKAANEFIDLCMRYENMDWDHPDDSKTLRQIETVAGKYMNNEEFKSRIEASKNEVAINRLQSEIEEHKQNMSQSISRGI